MKELVLIYGGLQEVERRYDGEILVDPALVHCEGHRRKTIHHFPLLKLMFVALECVLVGGPTFFSGVWAAWDGQYCTRLLRGED